MNKKLIQKIIIEYGGYCDGTERRTLTHNGEDILVEREFNNGLFDDGRMLYKGKKWSELLTELEDLNIDAWDQKYNDPDVMDGTQWSLDIEYSDGSEGVHFWGSNLVPDNFDNFLRVMEFE